MLYSKGKQVQRVCFLFSYHCESMDLIPLESAGEKHQACTSYNRSQAPLWIRMVLILRDFQVAALVAKSVLVVRIRKVRQVLAIRVQFVASRVLRTKVEILYFVCTITFFNSNKENLVKGKKKIQSADTAGQLQFVYCFEQRIIIPAVRKQSSQLLCCFLR